MPYVAEKRAQIKATNLFSLEGCSWYNSACVPDTYCERVTALAVLYTCHSFLGVNTSDVMYTCMGGLCLAVWLLLYIYVSWRSVVVWCEGVLGELTLIV